MNQFEQEQFSRELIWKIAFYMSPKDTLHFCESSTHIKNVLCESEDFWQQKFRYDFPEFWNPNIEPVDSWKHFYKNFIEKNFLQSLEEELIERVDYYLSSGIDPNVFVKGDPAFFMATSSGNVPLLKLFLESGVDPNLRGKGEWTALHDTIEYSGSASESDEEDEDRLLIVRLLLEAGANPNIKTVNGWTSLMLTYHRQSENIAHLLNDLGASPLTGKEEDFLAEHYYG